jgi:hypothetical protein
MIGTISPLSWRVQTITLFIKSYCLRRVFVLVIYDVCRSRNDMTVVSAGCRSFSLSRILLGGTSRQQTLIRFSLLRRTLRTWNLPKKSPSAAPQNSGLTWLGTPMGPSRISGQPIAVWSVIIECEPDRERHQRSCALRFRMIYFWSCCSQVQVAKWQLTKDHIA